MRLDLPLLALLLIASVPTTRAQGAPFVQPIPVEAVVGTRYVSTNLVMSRPWAEGSPLGVFHLTTAVLDYDKAADSDLTTQTLLFVEPVEGFRLTGGVFYADGPGFSPSLGVQFVRPGRRWFVLVSPRVNVEADPSYSVFSILRYTPPLTDRLDLYAGVQALTLFDGDGHIKSYQWGRLGVDVGGTQLGLALNLDEDGPRPEVRASVGLFARREL